MKAPRRGRADWTIALIIAAFGLPGCGDSGEGGVDIEASKRASAAGGLKFPSPEKPGDEGPADEEPASPALRIPKQ